MYFLRTLNIGDKFRAAHPRQISLNNRKMPTELIYRVIKVYSMSPYITISVLDNNPNDGFCSLGPGTPVLLPKEPNPTEDEVLRFIGVRNKNKVVAYRVLWDGSTDLHRILPPQAIAAMNLMYAAGKSEYGVRELSQLFNEKFEKFWGKPVRRDAYYIMRYYSRYLVNQGLIEEVVDIGPASELVREANLQEVL